MKPLSPAQLKAQEHKKKKAARRKEYADLQVQGTNNSSIVSKRSVESIYTTELFPELGKWFHLFVPKLKRRSPAINRGYFVRMESIRQQIHQIESSSPQTRVNIVNLGCGFDPLPFQLLHLNRDKYIIYDIDYPTLVQNKLNVIRNSSEILEVVDSDNGGRDDGFIYKSNNYNLIGCNLKDCELYKKQISYLDSTIPTIFIAEVSLAYMKWEDADKVIEMSSQIANSHFLILEQIIPDKGSFSKKMLGHFSKLRSPLQCVEHYPTKKHQKDRFRRYYSHVTVRNMVETWLELVPDEVKRKVADIEMFDEWEEFIMFGHHYVLVYGRGEGEGSKDCETDFVSDSETNKDSETHSETHSETNKKLETDDQFIMKPSSQPQLELKSPASCCIDGKVVTFGGLDQGRSDKTFEDGVFVDVEYKPEPRMAATFTTIDQGSAGILIGGRTRPGNDLCDVYKYKQGQWVKLQSLPMGISRHQTVSINDQEVLVVSGNKSIPILVYNHHKQTFAAMTCKGDQNEQFAAICSASIGYDNNTNTGIIIGGETDRDIPEVNSDIIQFHIEGNEFIWRKLGHNHQSVMLRIGPMMEMVYCDNGIKAVVIGGVSVGEHLGRDNSVVTVTVRGEAVEVKAVEVENWDDHSAMLVGANSVSVGDKICVVGGGAVCSSFGTEYNGAWEVVRRG